MIELPEREEFEDDYRYMLIRNPVAMTYMVNLI